MDSFSRPISPGNVLVTLSTVNSNSKSGQTVKTRPMVICDLWSWPTAERCRPANGSRLLYKVVVPRRRDYLVTKAGASTILDNQQTSGTTANCISVIFCCS
ncbi:nucleolar MIF4G domain-containing protein 1 [Trichinella spiralis]|uniref:nucleolar MIF4G domain-containing protein 1 n=1 Tax=Trichinella spiralis TaxID=6334 RepID=UPI0001EFC25F|nr:nucleolar MIF4G domain-containing protein 1 [Trichinella spiralis]